jgi:hypothetical protein
MLIRSKLKGPIGRIYPLAILLTYILGIAEFLVRKQLKMDYPGISIGPVYSTVLLSLFFLVMGIYQWYRYRLWIYPVLGLLAATGTIQSLSNFHIYSMSYFHLELYIINIFLVVLFVVFFWPTFSGAEKYEVNGKRLLKLAAELIYDTSDGFTNRPYSAGSVKYTSEELVGFARFLNGKFITRAYHQGGMVYLGFSIGKSPVVVDDPAEISNVMFDREGNVTVSISAFDYRQYRSQYNFEQLCATMGDVFKRFLEYYKDGNETRIITELKTAR